MCKQNTLIGLFLLGMFLSMSFSIENTLGFSSEKEELSKGSFETKYFDGTLQANYYIYIDFGYLSTFKVIEWDILSSVTYISCWIMTQSNYNNFQLGLSYVYYNLLDGEIGSTVRAKEWDSAWRIDFYADWVLVFYNNNLQDTYFTEDWYLYTLKASVSLFTYEAYSAEGDFYDDSLRFQYYIAFRYPGDLYDHWILDDFVTIKINLYGENDNLVRTYDDTIYVDNSYLRTYDFGIIPQTEEYNIYSIKIMVWWYSQSSTPDSYDTLDISEQFYPIGHAAALHRKTVITYSLIGSACLIIPTAIIITVNIVRKKKKTNVIEKTNEPIIEPLKFCPKCGKRLEASYVFCMDCGYNLKGDVNDE